MRIESETKVHLEDEDLARLLDGEGLPSDRAAAREHVAGCLTCSERLAELESASNWLSEHVPALDRGIEIDELARARALSGLRQASRKPRRSSVRYQRAAAAVVLVAAAGLAVTPVRAWVLDAAERLLGGDEPITAAVATSAVAIGAPVSFLPADATFSIELGHAQGQGQLTLHFVEGSSATAQVMNPGLESVSVLPAGLLIENDVASEASYTVEVPTGIVRNVRVIAGAGITFDLPAQEAGSSMVIDLAARSAQP